MRPKDPPRESPPYCPLHGHTRPHRNARRSRVVFCQHKAHPLDDHNELTVRDLLNDACAAVPAHDVAAISALFEQGDAVYWRATAADETGEMERHWRLAGDDGWWWRRFPSKLFSIRSDPLALARVVVPLVGANTS